MAINTRANETRNINVGFVGCDRRAPVHVVRKAALDWRDGPFRDYRGKK